MMRVKALALLLLAVFASGCATLSEPTSARRTIFEVEYVNFAWSPTWRGAMIDTAGVVHTYDLKGKSWSTANADYATDAELRAKYAQNADTNGSVSADALATMQSRATEVVVAQLSDPQNRCADAGTLTYTAWIYEPGRDAFRRVVLRREGDVAQLNQSAAGRAIADWLISLKLQPQLAGCQP